MKTTQGSNFVVDESPANVKENRSRSTLICKNQRTVVNRCARWVMPLMLFIFLALRPLALMAQTLPFMFIDDARVFEGNSGTKILQLPVHFWGAQPNAVAGLISATSLSGTGFNPATGGSSCGSSVDFVQQNNVPFTIPANTPNGTFFFNVTICGDARIEPDEQIFVALTKVSGADCSLEGACNAVATILNDDGTPNVGINDISASTLQGLSKTISFTVSLNHPSTTSTSVHFATRDGTAHAQTTTNIGQYHGTSGTLTIPANSLSGTIPVQISGFGGGTFFMDLSSPVNGNITDATGKATITITTLTIGTFDVSPGDAVVRSGEPINYTVGWTVPDGENWHALKTIEFRLSQGGKVPFWLLWDETTNTFSACAIDHKPAPTVNCTPGQSPGSFEFLQTEFGVLDLSKTTVVGSGPTGPSVTLNLVIIPDDDAHGHYDVELAASNDSGSQSEFFEVGDLRAVPEYEALGQR
jgi:hypothetical protein